MPMIIMDIKCRYSGKMLFSFETDSINVCVEAAVKAGANLDGASLAGASLAGSNLERANLAGANLERANLAGANLAGANLERANLDGAILAGSNLARANLAGANLARANLDGASLVGANLDGAYLAGANLERANLDGAENAEYALAKGRITPEEGAFVGWKKLSGNVIAKLIIPHDAERVNCFGSRKCRASKAYVESMFGVNEAYDTHTGKLLYKVGEWVEPDSFDPSITTECSHGIHFFLTRIEAEMY